MNKKITGVLIIIIGLLSILAIIYYLFFYQQQIIPIETKKDILNTFEEAEEIKDDIKTVTPPKQEEVGEKNNLELIKSEPTIEVDKNEIGQVELKRLASSFAERFGSFSNQANFENLKDLMIFMSVGMRARTEKYIKDATAARGDVSIYYGVNTKAVTTISKEFDEYGGRAFFLVKTIRQTATGDIDNISKKNQNIEIKLIKERGSWKVDEAVWK